MQNVHGVHRIRAKGAKYLRKIPVQELFHSEAARFVLCRYTDVESNSCMLVVSISLFILLYYVLYIALL
jgi:hypothetical protein